MNKRFAKFVSMALVLIMALGVLPMSAIAGGRDGGKDGWDWWINPDPKPNCPEMTLSSADGGVDVTVDAPEGALPKGTKMDVEKVADIASIQKAVDKAEGISGTVLTAVDITFLKKGAEVQPNGEVTVTMSSDDISGHYGLKVIHIKDNGTKSAPTIEEVEGVVGSGKKVTFKADSFSVYAVIGGESSTTTVEITFYKRTNNASGPSSNASDWEVINKQIVRQDQILDSDPTATPPKFAITDPGVPDMNANQSFEGWSRVMDFDENYNGRSVEQININAKADAEAGTLLASVSFYAIVYDVVYITYHDQAGAVLETESNHVTFNADGSATLSKKFDRPYTPFKGDQQFFGWTTADNVLTIGDYPTYRAETYYEADGVTPRTLNYASNNNNLDVYPYLAQGYWLIFDNNTKNNKINGWEDSTSASYTAPVLYLAGQSTTAPTPPTRTGYTFAGWYSDANMTRAFTWGSKLVGDTTVYAKWTPASTSYRVVFWQQKASDSVNATTKTYDYYRSEVRSSTTGNSVSITNADTQLGGTTSREMGYYFEYDSSNSNTASVNVKGDGSTVLNVYYNRRVISVYFYRNSNQTTQYSYSPLQGLYGAPISDWPDPGSGYCWKMPYNGTTYTMTTAWTKFVHPFETSTLTETSWRHYRAEADSDSINVHWYGQDLSGNYTYRLLPDSGMSGTLYITSNMFVGFTFLGYNGRYNSVATSSYWHNASATGSTSLPSSDAYASDFYLFFTRHQWAFTYSSNNSEVKTEAVYYDQSLSDFANYVPTNGPEGCYFDGWYADPGFNTPFNFSVNMPDNNVTVYAKWTQIRFRVVLDYNADGEDITFPGNQADSFRLDYGEQVQEAAIMAATRPGYVLLGWYYRENGTGKEHEFNFAMGAHEDMADMSYGTQQEGETYEAYLARMNSDARSGAYKVVPNATGNTVWDDKWTPQSPDRQNVRGKITIYAKWREDPEGVIGVHVTYHSDNTYEDTGYFYPDKNDRIHNDPNYYVDLAQAYAQPASTPDETEEQFLYWEILDADGNPTGRRAYPGQTWEVHLTDAKIVKILLPDPNCDHTGPRTHHAAVAATCEGAGNTEYWECDNCHKKFDAETGGNIINPTIPALGHDWGTPTYTWTPATLTYESGASCTGTCVCGRDNSHTVTETVTAVFVTDTPATTSAVGSGHYKATFVSEAFTEQNSAAVEIPMINAYTVTFSVPSGVTAPAAQEVTPGNAADLSVTPTGTIEGYTFIGWVESTVAETTTAVTPLSSYTPSGDATLYALYSRTAETGGTYELVTSSQSNWAGNYVITYKKDTSLYALKGIGANLYYEGLENGGTTPYASTGMTLSGNTLSNVSSYYVFKLQAASTSGYYTIQSLATSNYVARYATASIAELVSLSPSFSNLSTYNEWKPTYDNSNGHNILLLNNYSSSLYTYYTYLGFGSSYFWVDGKPTDTTDMNTYKIYLWKETSASGSISYYTTEPETTATYTVSFSVPAGVAAIDSVTVPAGGTMVLPESEKPTGYYFVGWSTTAVAETDTVPTDYLASGASFVPDSDVTLYAVYFYNKLIDKYDLLDSVPGNIPGYYVISSGYTTSNYMLKTCATSGTSLESASFVTQMTASNVTIHSQASGSTTNRWLTGVSAANRFRFAGLSNSTYDGYYAIINNDELYVSSDDSVLLVSSDLTTAGIWAMTASNSMFQLKNYAYGSGSYPYMKWNSGNFAVMSSSAANLYLWKQQSAPYYTSSPASTNSLVSEVESVRVGADGIMSSHSDLGTVEVQSVNLQDDADTTRKEEKPAEEKVVENAASKGVEPEKAPVQAAPAAVTAPVPVRDTTTTTPYSWDFETDPGFTFVDSDGDSYVWERTSTNTTVHGGSYALRSNSYLGSSSSGGYALNPDNWAFMPAVAVPADGTTTMTFWMRAQDQNWPGDIVRVYANSTAAVAGATPLTEDITTVAATENNGYVQITVDLTAYAGQTIYIGFRHYNCTDFFAVVIDDIVITKVVTTETQYHTVTFNDYDGTAIGTASVEHGYAIDPGDVPADPTREDHYFVAWQLNGANYDFETPVTGDITLTAAYTPMYSYEYTVTLQAVYGMVNKDAKTHIYWYANNDPTQHNGAGHRYVSVASDGTNRLAINEKVAIPAPAGHGNSNLITFVGDGSGNTDLTYDGHVFLGWARLNTEGSGTEGTAHPDLDEDDLYLRWDSNQKKYFFKDGSELKNVSQVYADEVTPYHDMYAVWADVFYVYHSGTNEVERFVTTKKDVKKGFDLAAKTASGYLYGGYYKSYEGVSTGFSAAAKFASDTINVVWNADGTLNKTSWTVAAKKDTGTGVKSYNGSNASWTVSGTEIAYRNDGSYTDDPGNAITPVAGTTYYIKEVDAAHYLMPYLHYTYSYGVIKNAWIISSIDDLRYQDTGFIIKKSGSFKQYSLADGVGITSKLKISTPVGGATPGEGTLATLTPDSVFHSEVGLGKNRLSYFAVKNSNTDLLAAGDSVYRYWVTLDGLTVIAPVKAVYSNTGDFWTTSMTYKGTDVGMVITSSALEATDLH